MTASVGLEDTSLLTGRCLIAAPGVRLTPERQYRSRILRTDSRSGPCPIAAAAIAIAAAQDAFNGWRKRTAAERGDLLGRWHDLMLKQTGDLGGTSTTETCGRAVASEI